MFRGWVPSTGSAYLPSHGISVRKITVSYLIMQVLSFFFSIFAVVPGK